MGLHISHFQDTTSHFSDGFDALVSLQFFSARFSKLLYAIFLSYDHLKEKSTVSFHRQGRHLNFQRKL